MANPLQRAANRRKVIYIALIFALFTLSIFWRGKLSVPFSGQVQASSALTRLSVLSQAERMELRELDQGDPDIAGATVRLSLVGARGIAVTIMWRAAIEKQKRNEFHEFEILARGVTRLQPNFITPWIFQSWNIAYNVSVENQKLGDMYFYIARGIELLAEGDRMNSKVYRTEDGKEKKVGSPDIRYQIGFYYQNKFSVSDKVSTLRSLMQVSCIKPIERRKTTLEIPGKGVDMVAFERFCIANPELVRRLQAKLNCVRPEEVVQFLVDNEKIPSLYKNDNELADPADQFPILPEQFGEGDQEYYPGKAVDDSFDAFHAARAWFAYSSTVIPPNRKNKESEFIPWSSPQPGEYDPFQYRMPRAPALIVFRQQGARAQSYLAERLTKEGWFDNKTTWNPDEFVGANNAWFRDSVTGTPKSVALLAKSNAQAEWARAASMWATLGQETGLQPSQATKDRLIFLAGVNRGSGLPPEMSREELAARGISEEQHEAMKSLVFYDQNRQITNFSYFLATSQTEQLDLTVEARKLLWSADQARAVAKNELAATRYKQALATWHEVLRQHPNFHRQDRSDKIEEDTYEYELNLIQLLKEDGAVRERTKRMSENSSALLGPLALKSFDDYLQAIAEDEAALQIAAERVLSLPAQPDDPRAKARQQTERVQATLGAFAGAFTVPEVTRNTIVRGVIDQDYPWMKEFKYEPKDRDASGRVDQNAYWVVPSTRESVKTRLGLVRKAPVEQTQPAADPANPMGP